MKNSALIIMAKAPEPGMVKTRLQPFLSPKESAELAGCLLCDTVNKAKSFDCRLIIAYSPPERPDFFEHFIDRKTSIVAQAADSDLGSRMLHAFKFAFEQGADSAVMIGTDSPVFLAGEIEKAFEYLEGGLDAVLGKTDDGGFYLIGLRKVSPDIFENVEWSSEKTFEQTVRNIGSAGLRFSEVAPCYDIDLPEDLKRCREELEESPHLAPETYKWFLKNEELF